MLISHRHKYEHEKQITQCPSDHIVPSQQLTSESSPFNHPFQDIFLPPEILQRICSLYFSTLIPLELTTVNATQMLHLQTALPLSIALSIPYDIYYANAMFSLSSCAPVWLLPWQVRKCIRRVRIAHERKSGKTPDWVYILDKALPCLTEIVFVVELIGLGAMVMEGWCECVKKSMKDAIASRKKGGVSLKVECGLWGFEEWIGKERMDASGEEDFD
ncbi:hypothetical protein GcM1_210041 [Golovinomyces cichoracearum]|uniref:Uncharacterized protein n=1 Tax=Golovinomyces cichoracearum TaxID=62708 RepID=A0A420IVJ8_9PEZI|nr:hypothetical protein GcM1_210041 [Golovinomyces cichoracearum]